MNVAEFARSGSSIPANAGSEIVLKIIDMITTRSEMPSERYLRSNTGKGEFPIKKASFFLTSPDDTFVGDRNVWMQDAPDLLILGFVDRAQALDVMIKINTGKQVQDVVPPEWVRTYSLSQLEVAAHQMRHYLLTGIMPMPV